MSKKWVRVSHDLPCPICGRNSWCGVSEDGSVARCMRQSNDHPCKEEIGGWIHRVNGRTDGKRINPILAEASASKLTLPVLMDLTLRYQARVTPTPLSVFARDMGLTIDALKRLGIGHDDRAWTFPMYSGDGKMIGIHRRLPDRKLMVKGSRLGLFIPANLLSDDGNGNKIPAGGCKNEASVTAPMLVCEGMSDTAAALDCGYPAVGLPSAGQGFDHATNLICRLRPPHVVVVADLDAAKPLSNGDVNFPGIESALKLSQRIMQIVPDLHFLLPPDGTKDLRAWLHECGHDPIRLAVASAPKVHREWLRRVWSEYKMNQDRYRTPDWSRQAATLLNKITDPERRADLRNRFEERAGIAEYDGGLPRDEAERIAFEEISHAVRELAQ